MIVEVSKLSHKEYRKHSISGSLRCILDAIKIGQSVYIDDVVDVSGRHIMPTTLRPHIKQVTKRGEKFVTRSTGNGMTIWRID